MSDYTNFTDNKSALANVAVSQTDSEIVAAVAGKRIVVMSATFKAGGTATNLTFNTASTAISPLYANGANDGEVLPHNPRGWFETLAGEALTVDTGTGSTTGILVNYVEVS